LPGPTRAGLADVRHRPLDRPHADRHVARRQQPLHHDRIARCRTLVELAGRPAMLVTQPAGRRPDLHAGGDRLAQIAPHRIHRDADLAGNRLLPDAAIRQGANRGHHVAFDHRYLRRRRYQNASLELHSTLLRRGQN
jgi:hypothetical protein